MGSIKDLPANVEAQALDLLAGAHNTTVANAVEYDVAIAFIQAIKKFVAYVEDSFKPYVTEASKELDKRRGERKELLEPAQKALGILQFKTTNYIREQEALRIAEEHKLREQAEAAGADPALVKVEKREDLKVDGISYRTIWRFNIVNFAMVPDDYKVLDESKLRSVVSAAKGNVTIPGIEIIKDIGQVVRK